MSTFSKAIPSALKELRFHFCQSSPSSAGLRSVSPSLSFVPSFLFLFFSFYWKLTTALPYLTWASKNRQYVNSGYSALKTAHPELKVLIREASAVSPRVFARFGSFPFPPPLFVRGPLQDSIVYLPFRLPVLFFFVCGFGLVRSFGRGGTINREGSRVPDLYG